MKFVRVFFLVFLFLFITVPGFIVQLEVTACMFVLNPDTYISVLKDNNIYEKAADKWKQNIEGFMGVKMSEDTAKQFNNTISTRLQNFTENELNTKLPNIRSSLISKPGEVDLVIDLKPLKADMQEDFSSLFSGRAGRSMSYILDEIPDEINPAESLGGEIKSFQNQYFELKFLLILIGVCILLSLGFGGLRDGLKVIGAAFVVSGFTIGIGVIVNSSLAIAKSRDILTRLIPTEMSESRDIVICLIQSFIDSLRNIGFMCACTGVLFFSLSFFIKKRREKSALQPFVSNTADTVGQSKPDTSGQDSDGSREEKE